MALADGTCQDFVYDDCEEITEQTIEVLHNITDTDNCQFFCSTIYNGSCKYFYHDKRQQICQLLSLDANSKWGNCGKTAGPKKPNIGDCESDSSQNSGCWVRMKQRYIANFDSNFLSLFSNQAFKSGWCLFSGSLLDHLNAIDNEEQCQESCQHVPGCDYYVFDKLAKDCELLGSDSRVCDVVGGPPTPDYKASCS